MSGASGAQRRFPFGWAAADTGLSIARAVRSPEDERRNAAIVDAERLAFEHFLELLAPSLVALVHGLRATPKPGDTHRVEVFAQGPTLTAHLTWPRPAQRTVRVSHLMLGLEGLALSASEHAVAERRLEALLVSLRD